MRVLSIDFDFIMHYYLRLYDDLININENPTIAWNILEQERNVESMVYYDAKALLKIATLIRDCVDKNAKLIPITSYKELVTTLDLSEENPISGMIHIGYHHGRADTPETLALINDMKEYQEDCWASYLYAKKLLKKLPIWVSAPESRHPIHESNQGMDWARYENLDIVLSRGSEFDYVVFNKCELYVPYKFMHLYDLIIELCKPKVVN